MASYTTQRFVDDRFANFLREVQQKEKAVEILEKAVGKMPLLWPAWVDLARLLPYDAEVSFFLLL